MKTVRVDEVKKIGWGGGGVERGRETERGRNIKETHTFTQH